jgi:hypothetical protein
MEFLGKNKKGGRPAFKPSKTMRNQVEIGAAAGLSHSQLSWVFPGRPWKTISTTNLKTAVCANWCKVFISLDRAQKRGSVAAAKFLVNAFNNGVPLQRMGKKERTRLEAENALANSPWADIIRTPKQAVE